MPDGCVGAVAGDGEVSVTLSRRPSDSVTSNGLLGIEVDFAASFADGHTLLVKAVRDGVAKEWNESNPRQSHISSGDRIVEVNGLRGSAQRLLEALQDSLTLHIVLIRQPKAEVSAGTGEETDDARDLGQELLACAGRPDHAGVAAALAAGADVASRASDGGTALLALAAGSTVGNCIKTLALLLREGPDLNAQNLLGESALQLAARNRNSVFVARLLQSKADMNLRDCFGETALTEGIVARDVGVVRLLLRARADVDHEALGPLIEEASREGDASPEALVCSELLQLLRNEATPRAGALRKQAPLGATGLASCASSAGNPAAEDISRPQVAGGASAPTTASSSQGGRVGGLCGSGRDALRWRLSRITPELRAAAAARAQARRRSARADRGGGDGAAQALAA